MEKWVDEGAADGFNMFMDVYPEGLRLSRARWFRFSRSAGGSVEATKQKLSGNGLVFHARKECCPPVRGPLPPFCRNSRADGKKFARRLLPPTRLRQAKAEVFAQGETPIIAVIQAAALLLEDHQVDEILKCTGKVGRRDDEAVASALNEPLFELVGEVFDAAHHCPARLRAAHRC